MGIPSWVSIFKNQHMETLVWQLCSLLTDGPPLPFANIQLDPHCFQSILPTVESTSLTHPSTGVSTVRMLGDCEDHLFPEPFHLLFVKGIHVQQKPSSALYWLLPINLANHKKVPWNTVQGHKSLSETWNLMGNKIPTFHLFPCLKNWFFNRLWALPWDDRGTGPEHRLQVRQTGAQTVPVPLTSYVSTARLFLWEPQFCHLLNKYNKLPCLAALRSNLIYCTKDTLGAQDGNYCIQHISTFKIPLNNNNKTEKNWLPTPPPKNSILSSESKWWPIVCFHSFNWHLWSTNYVLSFVLRIFQAQQF